MMSYHPILTQRFDTSDIAFTKIDKELAALRDTIRALHAFRNTFTPVYRLPPEILTRIFSFVRHVPKPAFYSNRATPLEWVDVTRVSQHWRNVAIGSPTLWSHISSTYPKRLAEEFLQRSKAAPLSIDMRGPGSQDADQFITPSLFRIRELTLGLSSASWIGLSRNLSSPAPLLESLSIMITDNVKQSTSSTISDTTFAGTTPRLRFLELTGCSVDINSSIFSDLNALDLCNPPQKLLVTDLLTCLRNLPRLTSLVLTEVLVTGAPLASSNLDTIVLASLASLAIRGGSFAQDLDILSHLSFPANTTLRFYSITPTGEGLPSLSEFLRVHKASRLQESSQPLQASLDLRCSWNLLRLFIHAECNESESVDSLLTFELVGQWGGMVEMPDQTETATLFSYLSLPSLTTFSTNCNIGVETWTNIFGPLPKLQHVSASGFRAINLLSAIVADFKARSPPSSERKQKKPNTRGRKKGKGSRSGGKQGSQVASTSNSQAVDWEPIFPQLETLELEKMTFPEPVTDLVAALSARKMVGKEIKSISVLECLNLGDEVLDALDGCVGEISWDGYTGSVDEDEDEDEFGEDYMDSYDSDLDGYFAPWSYTIL
ncbi:hypothetical protein BDN72DRAFT_843438 [Pluteus cervinus]|uniref:Uncharacterized protein n=1 Tax=Pluteus cervinus TaxID=181527 RepID=A0ACD3ANQ7_9AGAR|nr:hypothetical protein BDN72DRAFT_843438 [Pluteus cervinus]